MRSLRDDEHRGVDVIGFADGSEWSRAQIQAVATFEGDTLSSLIVDSAIPLCGGAATAATRVSTA